MIGIVALTSVKAKKKKKPKNREKECQRLQDPFLETSKLTRGGAILFDKHEADLELMPDTEQLGVRVGHDVLGYLELLGLEDDIGRGGMGIAGPEVVVPQIGQDVGEPAGVAGCHERDVILEYAHKGLNLASGVDLHTKGHDCAGRVHVLVELDAVRETGRGPRARHRAQQRRCRLDFALHVDAALAHKVGRKRRSLGHGFEVIVNRRTILVE